MLSVEAAIGQKLLIALDGMDGPSPEFLTALQQVRPAGVTLFRHANVREPQQVRQLTAALQAAAQAAGLPPLLIAADQEGGQLMAIGEGVTQLPGNLALGAAGSIELARQAGEVLGRELAAMGLNVDYAPCCDVNSNPRNPVIGTRSFGEDPVQVARLAAATIAGMQSQGVAATAKHFPGHGVTTSDSHHGVPVVAHSRERLEVTELPPFRQAIQAGVQLLMSAHVALPALTGRDDLPATLSREILTGLVREQLGFAGVVITDAMDMHAIGQGDDLSEEAVRAAEAGADLLLLTFDPVDWQRAYTGLLDAVRCGRIAPQALEQSAGRVLALKTWLAQQPAQPGLEVLGCAAHQAIADEIAARSITLVRDQAGLLPLRLSDRERLVVVVPQPVDLTPADTSSYVVPTLAAALRPFHPRTQELIVPHAPTAADIAATLEQIGGADQVVVGTLNAFAQPGQAALVNAILDTGIPTVVAALRMPYDLAEFPQAPTYLCSYSILQPSMAALARVLFGLVPARGRLPVSIPGLYPSGHGE